MAFCVGDKVKCVAPQLSPQFGPQLQPTEYTVLHVDESGYVAVHPGWLNSLWNPGRFELIREARHTTSIASPEAPRTTLPADSAERKNVPLWRGLLRYFPAALAGVARLSKAGNDKHNPGEEMHHARSKSTDHADCILRHLLDMSEDFGRGVGRDTDGTPFVDQIAWRALALAQFWHEEHDNAPMAPGAKP